MAARHVFKTASHYKGLTGSTIVGGHTAEYTLGKNHPNLSKFPLEIMSSIEQVLKEADELPRTILEYGDREAVAYLAWQMPFTFGCLERIFSDIFKRIPTFRPKNIFDFGTGPATAILAAEMIWKQSLTSVNAVDISEPMLQLARKLLSAIQRPADNLIKSTELRRFLSLAGHPRQYDLTVAAFSLGDLPDDGVRKMTVDALWEQTKDILVLVDRGTPEGSRVIANARKQILVNEGYLDEDGKELEDPSARKNELHIIAPCPHERRCPMIESWCHFSQRIETTKFQMEVNHVPKGFIDQKFSYIVFRRGPRPTISETSSLEERSLGWARLIRRPLKRQGHIVNDICAADSTFKRVIIPRSQGKQIYYDARKSKWGDLWPHPPKNKYLPIETMKIKPKRFDKTRKH